MLKYYLKQDNVAPHPTQNYLIQLHFNVKFSFLSLLPFLRVL